MTIWNGSIRMAMWKDRNFSKIRGDSHSSCLSIRWERDEVHGIHEIVDQLLTDKRVKGNFENFTLFFERLSLLLYSYRVICPSIPRSRWQFYRLRLTTLRPIRNVKLSLSFSKIGSCFGGDSLWREGGHKALALRFALVFYERSKRNRSLDQQ